MTGLFYRCAACRNCPNNEVKEFRKRSVALVRPLVTIIQHPVCHMVPTDRPGATQNTIKDPHRYAVQESDTTMMTRASMPGQ